jgi:predicted small lipoprotein YifL
VNKSRPGFRQIIAIGMIAGALGACGVKGDLEPPPVSATAAPAAEPRTQGAQKEKVFTEQSVVRRTAQPSVVPNMPPDEWTKGRNTQPAARPATRDKSKSDEPFFLDKLL